MLPAGSANYIPAPEKEEPLRVFGGCVRQGPDSTLSSALCYKVCRDDWTATIFSLGKSIFLQVKLIHVPLPPFLHL